MIIQENSPTWLSLPKVFRSICLVTGTFAVLMIVLASAAYAPAHPGFSPFTTFLSDIGDTPGWPQVIFNSGTLIAAPLRFLVIMLFVLLMYQLGAGRGFGVAVLVIGALVTLGTILMTAVPFSVGPTIHKAGILLYFFGVVVMQIVIGVKELSFIGLPRLLPASSFLLAATYLVFFFLMLLYELDVVSRTSAITPMIWQWLGFGLSIFWVYIHGVILGKR